jgi:16S rRNA (guanine966-N2)-methyltransferase
MAYRNTLRIIGGQWRRRQLPFAEVEGLRPTPDRVRETLFNWLGQDLYGQSCLDLFAGSGALGFEAASRGAHKVVMVEAARAAQQQLSANIKTLAAQQIELVCSDALQFLARHQHRFDVIFVDPPFASNLLSQVLPQLGAHLTASGLIYIECASWPELQGFELIKHGKAGQVLYGLLQRHPPEPG